MVQIFTTVMQALLGLCEIHPYPELLDQISVFVKAYELG